MQKLTNVHLLLTWLLAIGLALASVSGLSAVAHSGIKAQSSAIIGAAGIPMLVIGSSLMRHAVPPISSDISQPGIFRDNRRHIRLDVSSIREGEAVTLLEHAIDIGVKTILIEINPFGIDFAQDATQFRYPVFDDLRARARDANLGLSALIFGSEPRVFARKAENLDRKFQVLPGTLANNYPIRLRRPRHLSDLRKLKNIAAKKHVEIVLVAPPRSETAATHIGKEAIEALSGHFTAISKLLGWALFEPQPVWTNEYFIDQAHLNRRGRKRFLTELAAWYSSRQ